MDQDLPLIVEDGKGPVLHVVVVGFHHKKGCQVEYSYPPLIEGDRVDSHECPEEWKHLPSLALPDGSHNYEQDTIYFVMPSKDGTNKTVFCVSCYRQMNAENLLNRSADVTRGTVQKSVCVISTLPLFGLIQAKLELITHAYFDERDFSKVSLLQETFRSLNACLSEDLVSSQQIFLGMSTRDLVVHFKHKVVLLFKLVLLEQKVLVFKTPVKYLCSTILSLLSLFPGLIECGLTEAANIDSDNDVLLETTPENEECDGALSATDNNKARYSPGCEMKSNLDAATPENRNKPEAQVLVDKTTSEKSMKDKENRSQVPKTSLHLSSPKQQPRSSGSRDAQDALSDPEADAEKELISELEELLDGEAKDLKVDLTHSKLEFHCQELDTADEAKDEVGSVHGSETSLASKDSTASNEGSKMAAIKGRMFGALNYWTGRNSMTGSSTSEHIERLSTSSTNEKIAADPNSSETGKMENESKTPTPPELDVIPTSPSVVISLRNEDCGLPLSSFGKGVLCHPYLSLPYLDLLSDAEVRGFFVGATNVLFKQKQFLSDVIVEVDEAKIEINNIELRKQLHLTTEDLRFADYIVRHVSEDKEDVFLDGTGWEGSDEWLRAQFKYYLVCLLRTSLLEDTAKENDAFNPSFLEAWKGTPNYKMWKRVPHPALHEITPGHPFQGQLGVADMKLRFSHTMQSSERGRRINQAMANTGRAVVQTSKAVGGAISQAKSAVSSWLLTFSGPPAVAQQQQASQ